MQIDEDERIFTGAAHGVGRDQVAHGSTDVVRAPDALGSLEHRARMWQKRLFAAQEGLVPERAAVASHDGLIGHPQRLQGSVELGVGTGAISDVERTAAIFRRALPLQAPDPTEAYRPRDDRAQTLDFHGFDQVLERAVLDRRGGARQIGLPGHQHHGQIEIILTDRAEQLEPAHPRHLDVTDHGIERALTEHCQRIRTRAGGADCRARRAERAHEHRQHLVVVIDQEDLGALISERVHIRNES